MIFSLFFRNFFGPLMEIIEVCDVVLKELQREPFRVRTLPSKIIYNINKL